MFNRPFFKVFYLFFFKKTFEKDQRKKEANERKKVETKNRTIELIKVYNIYVKNKIVNV